MTDSQTISLLATLLAWKDKLEPADCLPKAAFLLAEAKRLTINPDDVEHGQAMSDLDWYPDQELPF